MIGTAGFHNAKDDWRQSTGIGSQSWGSSHEGSESIKQLGGDAQSYGDGSNGDKRRKITCDKSQRFTNVTSLGGLKHPLSLEDRKEPSLEPLIMQLWISPMPDQNYADWFLDRVHARALCCSVESNW